MRFKFLIYTVFLIGILKISVLNNKNETVKVVHLFAIEVATNIMTTITSTVMVMPDFVCMTATDYRVSNKLIQTVIPPVNKRSFCGKCSEEELKEHINKEGKVLMPCLLFVNEDLIISI